jgi:hypothetical protein
LDENNSSRDVYADSACRSEESIQRLEELGFREHLPRKGFKSQADQVGAAGKLASNPL